MQTLFNIKFLMGFIFSIVIISSDIFRSKNIYTKLGFIIPLSKKDWDIKKESNYKSYKKRSTKVISRLILLIVSTLPLFFTIKDLSIIFLGIILGMGFSVIIGDIVIRALKR